MPCTCDPVSSAALQKELECLRGEIALLRSPRGGHRQAAGNVSPNTEIVRLEGLLAREHEECRHLKSLLAGRAEHLQERNDISIEAITEANKAAAIAHKKAKQALEVAAAAEARCRELDSALGSAHAELARTKAQVPVEKNGEDERSGGEGRGRNVISVQKALQVMLHSHRRKMQEWWVGECGYVQNELARVITALETGERQLAALSAAGQRGAPSPDSEAPERDLSLQGWHLGSNKKGLDLPSLEQECTSLLKRVQLLREASRCDDSMTRPASKPFGNQPKNHKAKSQTVNPERIPTGAPPRPPSRSQHSMRRRQSAATGDFYRSPEASESATTGLTATAAEKHRGSHPGVAGRHQASAMIGHQASHQQNRVPYLKLTKKQFSPALRAAQAATTRRQHMSIRAAPVDDANLKAAWQTPGR